MSNWVNVTQDKSTGIELIHAHFKGFAYDPHLHSSYLIGVTELGHQQFNCRKKIIDSYQGQTFMLEPEEVHDGNAPDPLGFTYKMMHLDPAWLKKVVFKKLCHFLKLLKTGMMHYGNYI